MAKRSGRPRSANPRDRQITLALRRDELQRFRALASRMGLGTAPLVRRLAIHQMQAVEVNPGSLFRGKGSGEEIGASER